MKNRKANVIDYFSIVIANIHLCKAWFNYKNLVNSICCRNTRALCVVRVTHRVCNRIYYIKGILEVNNFSYFLLNM